MSITISLISIGASGILGVETWENISDETVAHSSVLLRTNGRASR